MTYLFVALGAMLRMFVSLLMPFPFGAMGANIIGSFAMGIAFVTIGTKVGLKEVLFLMTGILGGFTTFSTFSLDAFRLWEPIIMGLAVGYVTISVALSVLALCAGIIFVRGGNA